MTLTIAVATEPGKPDTASEDAAYVGPNIVIILDGATVRTDSGCIHGVTWYAENLASRISEHAGRGPVAALSAAITETTALHSGTCDLSHPGTPSAAVGIVQVVGETLRYLVLGDVTVAIDATDGLQVVSDQRISQTAAKERAIADAMTATDPRKPQALVQMKHAELAARNTPGGYWIAATDPSAAEHALTGQIPFSAVRRVGVFSDGAARAVDFGLYDWPGVLDLIERVGPGELLRQVRAAEATDVDAKRWPRNKLSDDATAAYFAGPGSKSSK